MTDQSTALSKSNLDANPIRQFQSWFEEARARGVSEQDATSMTLATSTGEGTPDARIVLLKSFDDSVWIILR